MADYDDYLTKDIRKHLIVGGDELHNNHHIPFYATKADSRAYLSIECDLKNFYESDKIADEMLKRTDKDGVEHIDSKTTALRDIIDTGRDDATMPAFVMDNVYDLFCDTGGIHFSSAAAYVDHFFPGIDTVQRNVHLPAYVDHLFLISRPRRTRT